jgi:predicted permease
MADLRFALRTLAKTPIITLVAIFSLALGIGANTAMFSLFDQVLLRPMPVPDPYELVNFSDPGPKSGSQSSNDSGSQRNIFSYPMLRDLEKQTTGSIFTAIAAHRTFGGNVAFRGQTSSSSGAFVSGGYFRMLGAQPAAGRLITEQDDTTPGGHPVAVLGHDYWNRKLGGRPDVVGEPITINGKALTIIGVAAKGFRGTVLTNNPDFFVPISMREELTPGWKGLQNRMDYWVYINARMKPSMSMEQAQTALNLVYTAIIRDVDFPLQKSGSKNYLERFKAKKITLEPGAHGQGRIRQESSTPLSLLFGITGFVLLIACANIANLLLARAANRSREISIRLSIGASRWQLVRQLMTESLVLALMGGLAGLIVSRWTLYLLISMMPAEGSQFINDSIEPRVVLFALAVSVLTGFLFGIFPALHSTRQDLASTLKDQAGQVSAGGAAARFRKSLVTAQIALSLLLLISAGFFLKSLVNISKVDLGIRTENLITFGLSPELSGYSFERSAAFFEKLEDRLRSMPGVTSAAGSLVSLIGGNNWGTNVSVDGFVAGPDTDTHSMYNEVSSGFFSTMGIKLLAGRDFTRADNLTSQKVAIINETFARKFHLKVSDAVGKRMQRGAGGKNDIEIIGVVQDTKYSSVKDTVPPLHYSPYRQNKQFGSSSFYVRTALDANQMIPQIRKLVAELDPQLPVEEIRTMEQQVKQNVFLDRMITTMASSFAVLATLLAAVGLYGVLAYSVARRTREFGIRLALGAGTSSVRNMVLKEVCVMIAFGALVGIPAALGLARLFESLLFGLKGNDALVIGSSTVVLALVSLLAGYLPALRATRIDPMVALRYE